MQTETPLVSIIMGSKSDWGTMQKASEVLKTFGIPHECRVLSAHRTPRELAAYMEEKEQQGVEVYIGGAGGAAHLPGVLASHTVRPVLGVPIESKSLQGLDSLLAIVQMPSGIPVGTLAIGSAGASNAALMAIAILGNNRPALHDQIRQYRQERAKQILAEELE